MLRAAALALALLPLACSDTAPCVACAPIEGRYVLVFEDQVESGCAAIAFGPPDPILEISRQGSTLSGRHAGLSLNGTLYESGDFRLAGSGLAGTGLAGDAGTQITWTEELRGRYLPPTGPADAGAGTLRGTFTATAQGEQDTCSVQKGFSGAR